MEINNTSKLFGTDEFAENSEEEVISQKNDTQPPEKVQIEKGTENHEKPANPPLFSRTFIISFTLLSLLVFLIIAIVSLHVKIQKTALSYELSAQTKLMRRLEKRKAMYELEYSFLRSKESINSKIIETGWKEITPHDIKFIKIIDTKKK